MDYHKYIKSDAWRRKRASQLSWAPFCQLCGETDAEFQVHHAHYKTLGREKVGSDIITLCVPCHEVAEIQRRQRNYKNKAKPAPTPIHDSRKRVEDLPQDTPPTVQPIQDERT